MAYTNFIAAIDLGTSHIVGMIGTKNPTTGALTIIAYEAVSSDKCIRRGYIYNVDEAAYQVKALIQKLNNKIPGERIERVYVGIGGQSIRSMEHIVTRSMGVEGAVTSDIIKSMDEECKNYKPEMLDVLDIVSPTYYLDNKKEENPVGVSCSRVEAHYKLIVGRPSLRSNIIASIKERAKIDIAGIFVSPIVLAKAVLSQGEKDLGCALISFGAGVTTISVYKHNELVSMCVIPLGGNLITKDIMSLNIVATEAERIKRAYGSVIIDKEDDSMVAVSPAEGVGPRQVKLNDLNMVVEARMQEIVENVYARVEETGILSELGAGIVITGGASQLKNLDVVLREKFGKEVRVASVRRGVIEKSMLSVTEPEYVAIGILMKGDKNCAYVPPKPPEVKPSRPMGTTEQEDGNKQNPYGEKEKPAEEEIVGVTIDSDNGLDDDDYDDDERNGEPKDRLIDKLGRVFGGLFDEDTRQRPNDKKK